MDKKSVRHLYGWEVYEDISKGYSIVAAGTTERIHPATICTMLNAFDDIVRVAAKYNLSGITLDLRMVIERGVAFMKEKDKHG